MHIENEVYEYVERLSTKSLVEIIEKLEDYELVSAALMVLGDRDESKMIELSNDIFVNMKGDKYLQAMTFGFVYSKNPYLAVKNIYQIISRVNEIVLRTIMEELVGDCYQEISNQFTPDFIRMINNRYLELNNQEKEYIKNEYIEFMETYRDKM